MAKVFRLFDIQGDNSIVDWQESKMYGTTAISEITDPDGATARKEITSIPSPFARIDLVKTAFREVVEMVRGMKTAALKKTALKGLIGENQQPSIYHKMVSEMFDVAELFFNYDRFKDRFEILVWDRETDLDPDSILGSTIRLYLESDSVGNDPYNFRRMNRIYLLNYIGPGRPSDLNIVGGTSPATLFFSSANDLSYVSNNILFDNDRPFDDNYQPLYLRSFDFQKYLFALRKSDNEFSKLFPEVDDYLDLTYGCLSDSEKGEIDRLSKVSINEYESIAIGERGQNFLEILGKPFHKKKREVNWRSDFAINSTINHAPKRPLVLPVEKGNMYVNLIYTTKHWEQEFRAPYYDNLPWEQRLLPELNEEYPYLTISDFLEDTIIRMPYEIDGTNFYDGGLVCKNEEKACSYLLPLKDTFFKFFTTEELQGEVSGTNKKMFEFVENVGGVKVILRIPIQRGFVEYSRLYFEGLAPKIENNDGGLVDTRIGLGVMPLVRFPDDVQKHYRIAFFDKGKMDATLSCYNGNDMVNTRHSVRAMKDLSGRGCSHEGYVVEDNFDRIQVHVGNVSSYIIPKFKKVGQDAAVFTFAVDFGTTNTHIEYCTDTNRVPKAFDIKPDEKQLHKLHKLYKDPDIRLAFEQDFIPDTIGERFAFPMRTVFATHTSTNLVNNPMPLCDGNIPFLYEKDFMPNWNKISTELKWGGVPDSLLRMHLETLFILMRNKVALNDGNLAATKVIWFYPASMTVGKINQFKQIWRQAYIKYFGPDCTQNVVSISESKAPYLHFIESEGAADEVVTIDIGGGTTDVFVVEDQEDKMLLSFRFASNAIFGDSYNSNPSKNGFVLKYKEWYKKVLESNGLSQILDALKQIEEQGKSTDIITFLFSLVGKKVADNNELDFLRKLSNDDRMRYVFIIFYGSILYYIANAMKAKGLKKPKTIAFSGNGARTVHILSEEDEMIARFAELIFNGVYGDAKGSIEVLMEANPKIATCKGGLERPESQPYETIGDIKTVFVGGNFTKESDGDFTYAKITEQTKAGVVKSVEAFFAFLFDLHKSNKEFLVNSLSADPAIFNKVKDFCLGEEGQQLLEVSMSKGLKHKQQSDNVNDDTPLEETLFFYPLVGLLHDLAYAISKME